MRAVRALPRFRRRAETARMGAANGGSGVKVHRRTGHMTQNPVTGLEVEVLTVVHSGAARLATVRANSRRLGLPGGDAQVGTREFHFPAATAVFVDGDLIEVVAGESAGTWWRVTESDRADQQTAYRVPVVAELPA